MNVNEFYLPTNKSYSWHILPDFCFSTRTQTHTDTVAHTQSHAHTNAKPHTQLNRKNNNSGDRQCPVDAFAHINSAVEYNLYGYFYEQFSYYFFLCKSSKTATARKKRRNSRPQE